jgi:hypothetical protein
MRLSAVEQSGRTSGAIIDFLGKNPGNSFSVAEMVADAGARTISGPFGALFRHL